MFVGYKSIYRMRLNNNCLKFTTQNEPCFALENYTASRDWKKDPREAKEIPLSK